MSSIRSNMAGLSRLSWTAGIVVGASLPHWLTLPPWMPALLCLCVAWKFASRILGWPVPGRWTMRVLTITAFATVIFQYRTINGLTAGTGLLFVMAALKFLEAKNQRDQILLIVLAYFIVFASLLAGGGLLKGIYLLGFVWIATLGLLQVGRQGPLLANRPTARLSAKLLLQSVPLMIVLFLLFPRLPGPLWSTPGQNSSATTGLSGTMSPGDITDLGLSDEIAFRVEFEDRPPAAANLYWRGPVLSNFDGRAWTRDRGMRRDVSDTIEYLGNTSTYEVMLEPTSRGWVFALEMPSSWQSTTRRLTVNMGDDYQLGVFAPDGINVNTRYRITSHSSYRAREPLTERDQEVFSRLPEGQNPRTRALVDGWLEDSPDASTIIERALDQFRGEGYFYTLTPPALGEHTADEFIFDTREGFCEHYASAFAIMMRMAGLPARVVTGYQGGELNEIGEYYIIRQSNAHAWTEVWTEQDGWTRVDPIAAVAPERIAFGTTEASLAGEASIAQRIGRMTLLRQAALAWDAANTLWDDWVMGYGPALQQMLLEWIGFERPRPRHMLWLTVAAIVLMMIGLTAYYGIRMRHWQDRDPAASAFRRFERSLSRAAVEPMRAGETPSAYAARAAKIVPGAAAAIASIADRYLAARYGPDRDGSELKRLQAEIREFSPHYAHASR